jgi:hypothetical protein
MKEITMAKDIHDSEYDVDIRPYITKSEKTQIVEGMLGMEDYFDRELYLDSALLELCAGIKESVDYDTYKSSGFILMVRDYVTDDIQEIYDAIKYYESVEMSVKQTLGKMTDVMEKTSKSLPSKAKTNKMIDVLLAKGEELMGEKPQE